MGVREPQIDLWGVRGMQQCCQQLIPAECRATFPSLPLLPFPSPSPNQCMIYVCTGPIRKLFMPIHVFFYLFSFACFVIPTRVLQWPPNRSVCRRHAPTWSSANGQPSPAGAKCRHRACVSRKCRTWTCR